MNDIRKVSVAVPVFSGEGRAEPLVEKIAAAMNPLEADCGLWRVNNGSAGAIPVRIRELCDSEHHTGFFSFLRNRGQSVAFGAGLETSSQDLPAVSWMLRRCRPGEVTERRNPHA